MPAALRNQRAQSLVEFTITLPLLIALLFGIGDIGRGFSTYIVLTNASREGARWWSTHPSDPSGVAGRVVEEVERIGLEAGDLTINLESPHTPPRPGDAIVVSVEHTYLAIANSITGLPSLTLTAETTMIVLYN